MMNRDTRTLIFTVIMPSLFCGAIAGAVAGYFIAKPHNAALAEKSAETRNDSTIVVSGSPSDAVTPADSTDEKPQNAQQAQTTPPSESSQNAAAASGGPYASPAPEALQRLGDPSYTQGTVQDREVDEKTGEINTNETLPDGSKAARTYRPDGSLKNEAVTKQDGSEESRSFFENGNVKVGYMKGLDGAATSVLYDSTGFITQRTTEYPDGSRIYYDYENRGTKSTAWRVYPDGRTEAYEEPGQSP